MENFAEFVDLNIRYKRTPEIAGALVACLLAQSIPFELAKNAIKTAQDGHTLLGLMTSNYSREEGTGFVTIIQQDRRGYDPDGPTVLDGLIVSKINRPPLPVGFLSGYPWFYFDLKSFLLEAPNLVTSVNTEGSAAFQEALKLYKRGDSAVADPLYICASYLRRHPDIGYEIGMLFYEPG